MARGDDNGRKCKKKGKKRNDRRKLAKGIHDYVKNEARKVTFIIELSLFWHNLSPIVVFLYKKLYKYNLYFIIRHVNTL